MSFGNLVGGQKTREYSDYQRLTPEGGESTRASGKIHKATDGEVKSSLSDIGSKTLSAMKSVVGHLDVTKHIAKLKSFSNAIGEFKTLLVHVISLKLSKSETKGAATQLKDLIDLHSSEETTPRHSQDLHAQTSSHLLDSEMHPKVLDLLGEASDLERSITGWTGLNTMLERGSSLKKSESVSLDDLLALLPDKTLSEKDQRRLNSDAKIAEMVSHAQDHLLESLRSTIGHGSSIDRTPSMPSSPTAEVGNPFATSLQRKASSLKLLTREEMLVVKKQMSERLGAAKKIHVQIKDAKQVVQEAKKQGVVEAKEARDLLKGMDLIGAIAAKETAVTKQLSKNLENWTIPAQR